MNIIEIIRKRRSCRLFNNEYLKAEDKIAIENFIKENSKAISGERFNFIIVEKGKEIKQMKIDYGIIQGHKTYILGNSEPNKLSRVNYGYVMEKIVLKATEINLATCWVGYFDREYFKELKMAEGYEIPSIIMIGYADDIKTFKERIARFAVNASKRSAWDKMFFNYKSRMPLRADDVKEYSEPLEMVRLAPSSGNTQPWRIYYDISSKEFHFYKQPISSRYEAMGLHDIDMGIALSHFELTSVYKGLAGKWFNYAKGDFKEIADLQYKMTWKAE